VPERHRHDGARHAGRGECVERPANHGTPAERDERLGLPRP
jgi:hypothetical protein